MGGTPGVTIGQVWRSVMRAAGGMRKEEERSEKGEERREKREGSE
jgi:hypothetical protein